MNKFNLWSALAILVWLIVLVYVTTTYAKSEGAVNEHIAEPIDAENVESVFDKPAQEPETYSDWFKKNAERIDNCKITHYCCEAREHICGTGDGVTASGVPVIAGWSCAVDPNVIPLGFEVMVDYGDRIEFYKAQDTGGAIKGNHIDLAVESRAEALEKGVEMATVYFMEVFNEFD